MTQVQEITDLLAEFDELRSVLDDLNVKYVTIAANGHWSFEKLGRTRHGAEPLPQELLLQLAQRIPAGRHARGGEWALRKYEGVAGPSLLIERLPIAVADRLPQEVLSTLKQQVKAGGNGLLLGQPGAGKGALMLWLALQIPDRPVLYVAENPPSEFPGNHIMHVYPPSTQQERRALERFVRLSPTVMWDRVASGDDLLTLFGFPGARGRWFTLDSSSVRSALRMLTGAAVNGCDARFSTLLALSSSVIGRPEARNLLVRSGDGWSEEYTNGESCLDVLAAYDTSDIRRLSPTEVSTPGTFIGEVGKVEVAEDFALEAESVAAPVRHQGPEPVAGRAADAEAAAAKAVEEVTAAEPEGPVTDAEDVEEVEDVVEEVEEVAAASTPPPPEEDSPKTIPVELAEAEPGEAVTGMLPRDEIRELRDKREARRSDELEAADRSDVPPPPEKSVPEVTKTYREGRGESDDDDYLREAVASLDEELEPGSAVGVDGAEPDMEIQSDDEYEEAEDFSGVFDGDLDFDDFDDFDDLADEMVSEISEADLIEEPSRDFGETNPEQPVYLSEEDLELIDPDETNDTDGDETVAARVDVLNLAKAMADARGGSSPDASESTKEFTLDERLLERQKQDD